MNSVWARYCKHCGKFVDTNGSCVQCATEGYQPGHDLCNGWQDAESVVCEFTEPTDEDYDSPCQCLITVKTINRTDPAPRPQGPNSWGGWVDGEAVDIRYDPQSGTYGYCFWWVYRGIYGETNDVLGFTTVEAAAEAAEAYALALAEDELDA